VNGDDEAEREPLWKMDKQAEAQAMALLRIALDEDGDDDGEVNRVVREEDQKSLRVGIVGAPNAGKSKLTNLLVRRNPVSILSLDLSVMGSSNFCRGLED
jgi:putative protein kinase ArgK-like GTPase of G3E family